NLLKKYSFDRFEKEVQAKLIQLRSAGGERLLPETFAEVKGEVMALRELLKRPVSDAEAIDRAYDRAKALLLRLESLLQRAQSVQDEKVEQVVLSEERWLDRIVRATGTMIEDSGAGLQSKADNARNAVEDLRLRSE